MMKRVATYLVLSGWLAWSGAAAQTHKVARPESVVRAVGVYEWTGDLAKPTASRLIPVSLEINGALEDAGVYMARPIPFALLPGNDYLLQLAGVDRGSVALLFARHLANEDSAYEDGWFGYGNYKPLPPPKKQPALRASRTPGVITGSGDGGRPHLTTKSSGSGDQGATPAATKGSDGSADADPDRPHLTRKDDESAQSSSKSDPGASQPADTSGASTQADPDRPTMRRHTADTSTTNSNTTADAANVPSDDPDRPTLKRHSADEGKKRASADDMASVTGTGSLNDDPDRPNLHRGKPAGVMTEADLPKLTGLPTGLHQMIAVSDAVTRPEHDFARAWDDENEKAGVLSGMQALAREQLGFKAVSKTQPTPAPKSSPSAAKASGPARPKSRTAAHRSSPIEPLLNKELKPYTLSYGGAPTFVYTAHTAGDGTGLRYVTIVAERDAMGALKPALRSATDATHFDRTPRMRLVDAVDADASNRASLLFELRAQSSRQFALYRVLGASAQQTLLTGSTE